MPDSTTQSLTGSRFIGADRRLHGKCASRGPSLADSWGSVRLLRNPQMVVVSSQQELRIEFVNSEVIRLVASYRITTEAERLQPQDLSDGWLIVEATVERLHKRHPKTINTMLFNLHLSQTPTFPRVRSEKLNAASGFILSTKSPTFWWSELQPGLTTWQAVVAHSHWLNIVHRKFTETSFKQFKQILNMPLCRNSSPPFQTYGRCLSAMLSAVRCPLRFISRRWHPAIRGWTSATCWRRQSMMSMPMRKVVTPKSRVQVIDILSEILSIYIYI